MDIKTKACPTKNTKNNPNKRSNINSPIEVCSSPEFSAETSSPTDSPNYFSFVPTSHTSPPKPVRTVLKSSPATTITKTSTTTYFPTTRSVLPTGASAKSPAPAGSPSHLSSKISHLSPSKPVRTVLKSSPAFTTTTTTYSPTPSLPPSRSSSVFTPASISTTTTTTVTTTTTTTTTSTTPSTSIASPEYPYQSTGSPSPPPSSSPSPPPSPAPTSSSTQRVSLARKAKKPLPAAYLDKAPLSAARNHTSSRQPRKKGPKNCEIVGYTNFFLKSWLHEKPGVPIPTTPEASGTLDMPENPDYKIGDCVRMEPDDGEYVHFVNKRFVEYLTDQQEKLYLKKKLNKCWIGRIVGFVIEDDGEWSAEVQYFWYPEHTFLYFNDLHPKMLCLVEEKLLRSCSKIISKCEVKHRTEINDFNEWTKHEDHFFYDHIYSHEEHSFVTPPQYLVQGLEPKTPNVLELFAGAGGMSEGLKRSGLPVKWAVEFNKHAAQTLRNFHPHTTVFQDDVNAFLRKTCYLNRKDFQRSYTLLTDAEKVKDTKMGDMDVQLDKGDYKVEKLVGKRIKGGKTEYLIKWEGWELDEKWWQTADTIFGSLVEDYERELLVKEEMKRRKKIKENGIETREESEEMEVKSEEKKERSEIPVGGKKRKSTDRFSHASEPSISRPRRTVAQYSAPVEENEEGRGKEKGKKEKEGKGAKQDNKMKKEEDIIDLTNIDEIPGEERDNRVKKGEKGEMKKVEEEPAPGKAKRKREVEEEGTKSGNGDEEITILQMRYRWGRKRYYTLRKDPNNCTWETKDELPVDLLEQFKKKKKEPTEKRSKGKKYKVKSIQDFSVDEQGHAQFLLSWVGHESKEDRWLDEEDVPKEIKKEFLEGEREKYPFKNINALFGGTPCKGFSHVNRQRDSIHPLRNINNQLVLSFLDEVDLHRPDYGIVENVTGILSLAQGFVIKQIFHAYISMGYQVALYVLNSAYYGAPQSRNRVIIFAAKNGLHMPRAPVPSHNDPRLRWDNTAAEFHANIIYPQEYAWYAMKGQNERPHYLPFQTVRQAIGDLPKPRIGKNDEEKEYYEPFSAYQRNMRRHTTETTPHNHEYKRFGSNCATKMTAVPKDGPLASGGEITWLGPNTKKVNLDKKTANRSSWQRPFGTIVTNPAIQYASMVHPCYDRYFSVRELARGQGFPDDCIFYGGMQEQYKQIGNAVPVALAEAIGREVFDAIRLSTKPAKQGEKEKPYYVPSIVLIDWVDKGWTKKNGVWQKILSNDASMGEKKNEKCEKNSVENSEKESSTGLESKSEKRPKVEILGGESENESEDMGDVVEEGSDRESEMEEERESEKEERESEKEEGESEKEEERESEKEENESEDEDMEDGGESGENTSDFLEDL